MPSRIDFINTKLEVDKRINEIKKKRNEDLKIIEDLKKNMEEMEKKMNYLMNNMNNIFQIKECDEKTKLLAAKIKTQVEKIIKRELPIYEPVGFKNELNDGKENYVIKVHIGGQNYIHISVLIEVKKEDIIDVKVFSDKKLNDQL